MADIFEIVGRISLDGMDRAERELNNLSDTGEKSSSKLSKLGGDTEAAANMADMAVLYQPLKHC